jgi:glycosyltransferase involved in cell wall biosynthesis
MGCSKFDDRSRSALRESAKQLFVAPYQGALVGSSETARFLRFLGLSGRPVALGYNSVSTERFVRFAGTGTVPFAERDFIVVARLVPKKNIAVVLRAYAGFIAAEPGSSRRLRLCGDGPLDGELRALAGTLGIADRVLFEGFLQSEEIAPRVAAAAALILVSTEEQFGNVVPEALAVGTPLILSDICGARYELLRTGVNGFVVEPDNVDGLTALMRLIVADEARWTAMSVAARALAPLGDTARFAEGVADLVGVAAG